MEEEKRSDMLQQSYEALDSYTTTDSSWTDFGLRLPIPIDAENTPLPLISSTESLQRVAPAHRNSSPPPSPDTIPPAIVTFPCQAAPLYWQPGITGRCTSVIPAKPPSDPNYEDLPQELVAKRSWQPKDRLGEDAIIAHIRSLITPHWKKHITDIRGSGTQTMEDLKLPRNTLADIARREIDRWRADPRAQSVPKATANELRDAQFYRAFVGEALDIRIFRTLICVRNLPLRAVKTLKEFMKVFLDVVKAHYVVHTEAHVLHRDLNVNNVMFKRGDDDQVVGVIDWDLAAPLDSAFNHRTGGAAFMALELLENQGAQITHEYRHDLESFGWILIWCAFELEFDGRVVGFDKRYSYLKEWTDTTDWATLKSRKLDFVLKTIGPHRGGVTQAMKPLENIWLSHVFLRMGKTLASKNRIIIYPQPEDEDDSMLLPGMSFADFESIPQAAPVEPESESFFTFTRFLDHLVPREKGHHVENLRLRSH